jgi:hypothetical protein
MAKTSERSAEHFSWPLSSSRDTKGLTHKGNWPMSKGQCAGSGRRNFYSRSGEERTIPAFRSGKTVNEQSLADADHNQTTVLRWEMPEMSNWNCSTGAVSEAAHENT